MRSLKAQGSLKAKQTASPARMQTEQTSVGTERRSEKRKAQSRELREKRGL